MNKTPEQLAAKLKEVEAFEAKWGECIESRAMRKYCTDERYRERVHAFNQSIARTFKHYKKYGNNQQKDW